MARLVSRNYSHPTERNMLIIVPETEEESKAIDKVFGNQIPTNVEGHVELSDGYGQHYIALEPQRCEKKNA